MLADLRYAQVAGGLQTFDQWFTRQRLATLQRERARGDIVSRWQALQQHRCGGDDDALLLRGQCRQYGEALGDDVLVRRKAVPRQGFPLDEMLHRDRRPGEETQLGFQLISVARIFCQYQQRCRGTLGEFRDRQRGARAEQTAAGHAVADRRQCLCSWQQ